MSTSSASQHGAPLLAGLRRGGLSLHEPALLRSEADYYRQRRLAWLLIGAWIINLFDLGFTLLAAEQHVLIELNPVAARVQAYGPEALAAYKLALLTFGTGILWRLRLNPFAERCAWVYLLACFVLSFWWRELYLHAQPAWMMAHATEELLPSHTMVAPAASLPTSK